MVLALAAVACFAALDTSTKYAGQAVPLVMALWCRYAFQALATAATLLPGRGRTLLHTRRPGLQLLRGVLLLACSVFAFASLRFMALGDVTAIGLLTPLAVTLVAVAAFGEKVSPLRWACVAGGFVGALAIVRPGGAMLGWVLLLPLGLLAANTGFQIVTSRLSAIDDAGTTQFYTGCIGAVLTTLLLPFFWTFDLAPAFWGVLLLLGVFGTLGHFLLLLAYEHAPATQVMPFLYAQIAFAVLAGWWVFAHAPDAVSLAGIALIAVSGAAGTWLAAREKHDLDALAAQPPAP